jgi:hypothetical protein
MHIRIIKGKKIKLNLKKKKRKAMHQNVSCLDVCGVKEVDMNSTSHENGVANRTGLSMP